MIIKGLLWSNYADLAESGHHIFLAMLYAAHLGNVHLKALASSFVQWPGTDSDIGRIIKQNCTCQATQHNSANAPTIPESEIINLGQQFILISTFYLMGNTDFSKTHFKIPKVSTYISHILVHPEYLSANYFAMANSRYLCEGNDNNFDDCHVQS